MFKVNQLQIKLKNVQGTSQTGLESLKIEIKARDDTIHKLRQEILEFQDKRDAAAADVSIFLCFKLCMIDLYARADFNNSNNYIKKSTFFFYFDI